MALGGMAVGLLLLFLDVAAAVDQVALTVSSAIGPTWDVARYSVVGSGHAALTLRQDWRRQLVRAKQELGISHVRFHGLLDDDMGPVVRMDAAGSAVYNFSGIDSTFDFLHQNGIRPFVELSFMPTALASSSSTYLHYKANVSPPRSLSEWEALIAALASHWVQRYGEEPISEWWIECWNEPNLKLLGHGAFWTGNQEDYFALYNATAWAFKAASPKFRVGGPATSGGAWLPAFVQYCQQSGTPVDFVSTHGYPTEVQHGLDPDAMRELFSEARSKVPSLPLVFSEYNSGLYDNLIQNDDSSFAAAFAVKAVMEAHLSNITTLSYWTFSDIFEELRPVGSKGPFYNGYGMMTAQGIAKPVYRAFEMLQLLRGRQLQVTSLPAGSGVAAICTLSNDGSTMRLLVSNFRTPGLWQVSVNVSLQVDGSWRDGWIQRIDEHNANPLEAWWEMGKPGTLSSAQLEMLHNASIPPVSKIEFLDGCAQFVLPPNGVALIELHHIDHNDRMIDSLGSRRYAITS
eukprot:TRINITY_DN19695_c0_g1_i1.p1 TRINITY_DN19695_c0_g1~~TRINITY_DN19695_c0_g1_i1.p1  ORF type:complete len:516 (+),score=81.88 TRINITY_DN19695_c0_g1_i1:147-1694(+)